MSIRRLLERVGLIEPRPPEIDEVRSRAMEINDQAREEITRSRMRRSTLDLEYQLARRKH